MAATFQPEVSAGTTRFITRTLFVASGEPRYAALFPAGSRPLYEPILRAAGDTRFVRAATFRVFRAAFLWAIGVVLPGIAAHYLARKRCLEDFLRRTCEPDEAGKPGCRQVVILGAGLDTLAWRMHGLFPEVRFIEVDRPAALQVKEQAMSARGERRPNLTFLPADLSSEPLARTLARAADFDPSLPTFFLAEGLLMYLPPARVRALLREISAMGSPATSKSLAYTFMEARIDGSIGFRRSNPLVNRWLRRQGEPFRWSQAPADLSALLEPAGWHLRELVSGDDLRARYLNPAGLRDAPLAVGEWLAVAETKEAR